GLPAPAVAGVRMAHEPGAGRSAVPVRSMVAGATIAIAVLAAVGTFVASLDHLLATPKLYGWNWDLTIGDGYGPVDANDVPPVLQIDPNVESYAEGTTAYLDVAGHSLTALAVSNVRGSITPAIVEG